MKIRHDIKKTRFTGLTISMLIVLIIYTISLIGLLFWAVVTSFRSNSSFLSNPIGFGAFKNNFETVFKATKPITDSNGLDAGTVNIGQMYLYSILYAVGCAFANTIVPCLTSYFAARYKFAYSKIIYSTVIVVMIVPIVGSLPSEIQVARTFGLYNQIWGLWIMKANFLGLYFLVFYEFFHSMPDAYVEAAKIDGAGHLNVLFRIALPMARNVFITIMLINFITFWNDYQVPVVYLPSYPTIANGIYYFTNGSEFKFSFVPAKIAATVTMFTPILILFLCTHKRLMGNLTVGGIKG